MHLISQFMISCSLMHRRFIRVCVYIFTIMMATEIFGTPYATFPDIFCSAGRRPPTCPDIWLTAATTVRTNEDPSLAVRGWPPRVLSGVLIGAESSRSFLYSVLHHDPHACGYHGHRTGLLKIYCRTDPDLWICCSHECCFLGHPITSLVYNAMQMPMMSTNVQRVCV
jgi:hypothetical protein